MKGFLPVGKLKYFAYVMVIIQGVLLFVIVNFFLGDIYLSKWQNYPNHKEMIYLNNLSKEVETATASYLFRFAEKEHLFLARIDSTSNKHGNFGGYVVGVWGRYPARERRFFLF